MTVSTKPLTGVVVVALEQAVAAPLCSRHLADLGAEVIKIERIDGGDFARDYDAHVGGMSSHFVWLNWNKRSLALNLKTDEGKGVLLRLLEEADVFLSNLAPGAIDRLVTEDELATHNPSLIRCEISGYGPDGPYQHRKAFDLLVQGEAGVTASTGEPDHPAKPGVSLADLGGGIYAATSIIAALYQRKLTGKGDRLHIAMFDVLAEWMTPLLLAYTEGGVEVQPAGTRHATITPYGPFPTSDGREVNIAVQNDRQWVSLCQALGEPALGADPRLLRNSGRLQHRERVEASVSSACRKLTTAELTSALDARGVPWGMLNRIPDVVDHPQLASPNRWADVQLPTGGHARVLASPFRSRAKSSVLTDRNRTVRVPDLGEDTLAVLEHLGYANDTIKALEERGVVSARVHVDPVEDASTPSNRADGDQNDEFRRRRPSSAAS